MYRRKFFFISLVVFAILIGLYFYIQITKKEAEKFRLIFFNVGQGDSVLIRFDNGEKMLVDCGIDRKILIKLGKYLPFYDRQIDYLLVTHPDADHYGGCAEVLKRYEVKNIIWNGEIKASDPYWPVWEKYFQAEGANSQIIVEPKKMVIGDSVLNFLSPDPDLDLVDKLRTGNNNSIVFTLEEKSKKYFFAGDMEIPLELALLKKYCSERQFFNCLTLRAEFLKIGHHGSDSSSDVDFLRAINPNKAIISVGKNSYGHPSFRVLMKLRRQAVEIWRTDEEDDIILE